MTTLFVFIILLLIYTKLKAQITINEILEKNAEILSEKNRDLEDSEYEIQMINQNLEIRIEEEVAHSRQKDQQLLSQSRLAQMGEMISMIAHQWRQPLAAISAVSTFLELKASTEKLDTDLVKEKAQQISKYTKHLSNTIDDFRNFFKQNKEKQTTSYDEIVKAVISIVEHSLKSKNIELTADLKCKNTFEAYPNELKQVVLNLIKNAEDVLIKNKIKNPYIKISTYKKEDKCTVEISDNAGGISEDIIDKIFEPYFSTKESKNATGLGLYMSKIIVEEHCQGKLEVSNSEIGAVFKIIL